MDIYLKNTRVYQQGSFSRGDALIRDGKLFFPAGSAPEGVTAVDGRFICILPGLADVHVHLREPGFSYKETIRTGTMAAARGGYTAVCPMPNLNPVPDSLEALEQELSIIRRDAVIPTIPYGSITRGEAGQELADMEAIAPYVAAFSDDGKGVQDPAMMARAMEKAKVLGKIIAAHCEDNALLHGGYIHDGTYAAAHGHRGICSESEYGPIRRDAALAGKTGCAYHVCHVSTRESVDIIRHAKSQGVDITCETAPHYLLLDDSMLQEDGRFKMNPPLRSPEDRQALIAGLLDGTIDMIATDHAPHSREEKSRGLKDSPMGVVGLECAFPVLYTGLVETGILPLERLVALMSDAPRARFSLESDPGFALFDLAHTWQIDPEGFASLGRATPFEGASVRGRCLMTVCQGREVYIDPMLAKEAGQ
ncbi:MAG: dihydroorotase [Oscillospiraceae bacterium]|nr:dihydroorotase [Oscillospiraceae bacterium]